MSDEPTDWNEDDDAVVTYESLPDWHQSLFVDDIRRATQKLDVSIDQTFVKPPTKKGYSKKTLAERVRQERARTVEKLSPGPVDVFAGLYPKKGRGLLSV